MVGVGTCTASERVWDRVNVRLMSGFGVSITNAHLFQADCLEAAGVEEHAVDAVPVLQVALAQEAVRIHIESPVHDARDDEHHRSGASARVTTELAAHGFRMLGCGCARSIAAVYG